MTCLSTANYPKDDEKAGSLDISVTNDHDRVDQSTHNKLMTVDSGYSSLTSTPTQDKSQPFDLRVVSTIEVPKELDRRFFDLKMLYSQPLLEAISKGKRNHGDISMKLKYMGIEGQPAQPYIVIHCNKRVAKRVKNFFSQKHVMEDLKSDFQVHIIDTGLVSLATLSWIKAHSYAAGRKTMCGTKIILAGQDPSSISVATLGGLIMAEVGASKVIYGITAGHAIVRAYGQDYFDRIQTTTRGSESDDDDDDDESDSDDGYHGEEGHDDRVSHSAALDAAGWQDNAKPPVIGLVGGDLLPAAHVNYDWGLVAGLERPTVNALVLHHDEQSRKVLFCEQIVSIGRRETRRVVVMTSRGYQQGTLAANGSTMVSAIGRAFVYAFDFVPDTESSKCYDFQSTLSSDETLLNNNMFHG